MINLISDIEMSSLRWLMSVIKFNQSLQHLNIVWILNKWWMDLNGEMVNYILKDRKLELKVDLNKNSPKV